MASQIFFICLIAGLVLVGGEIFVPGGVLGVLGGLLVAAAIVDAFVAFPSYGPYVAVAIIVFVGIAFYLWIKIFPNTAIGRRMTVSNDLGSATSVGAEVAGMAGKNGIALSDLRPAGYVQIDGRRVDVVTRGEMIPRASRVRVVAVEGNNVIVAQTAAAGELPPGGGKP